MKTDAKYQHVIISPVFLFKRQTRELVRRVLSKVSKKCVSRLDIKHHPRILYIYLILYVYIKRVKKPSNVFCP